jgi:hypothetical protein
MPDFIAERKNKMKCFAGDDCTLIYYYECEECGTIVVVDNSDYNCLHDWECPICKPVNNFPWQFITKEDIDNDEGNGLYITERRKLMNKELRVMTNIYLPLKKDETKEEAMSRLFKIISNIENFTDEIIIGELFDFELQEDC